MLRRTGNRRQPAPRVAFLAAQTDEPDDYVVASGEVHSLAELIVTAFAHVGITDWGRYVTSESELLRPADAETLVGNSTRLRTGRAGPPPSASRRSRGRWWPPTTRCWAWVQRYRAYRAHIDGDGER
jgi:hypothetical protein